MPLGLMVTVLCLVTPGEDVGICCQWFAYRRIYLYDLRRVLLTSLVDVWGQ